MILPPTLFENVQICIVNDNAKTHEPLPKKTGLERRHVKRSSSMPMDLTGTGPSRRRRRPNRRGSDPPSRWSAEPSSPPSAVKKTVTFEKKVDAPPTCVLRNVVKPVRQESLKNLHQQSSCNLPETGGRGRGHSLMPMMPVRQRSLRDMVGGCSPHKEQKMDTVTLITQALERLDSLAEMDDDHIMDVDTTCSLPTLPTVPLD